MEDLCFLTMMHVQSHKGKGEKEIKLIIIIMGLGPKGVSYSFTARACVEISPACGWLVGWLESVSGWNEMM